MNLPPRIPSYNPRASPPPRLFNVNIARGLKPVSTPRGPKWVPQSPLNGPRKPRQRKPGKGQKNCFPPDGALAPRARRKNFPLHQNCFWPVPGGFFGPAPFLLPFRTLWTGPFFFFSPPVFSPPEATTTKAGGQSPGFTNKPPLLPRISSFSPPPSPPCRERICMLGAILLPEL